VNLKVTFAVLNLCCTHKSGRVLTTVCLHINWKVQSDCHFNFILKGEGLFKVTRSHLYWKSSNISQTVLDKDILATGL